MTRWHPITEPATADAYAPNQVPYDLTDAEKSKAAIYSIQLERQRRERNARDAQQKAAADRRQWRGAPTEGDAA